MPFMSRIPSIIRLCLGILTLSGVLHAQLLEEMNAARVVLPNGWSLTPAGRQMPLGDLPLNIAVSRPGSMIAVTNNGQSDQSIYLIDAQRMRVLDTCVIGKAWYGLA